MLPCSSNKELNIAGHIVMHMTLMRRPYAYLGACAAALHALATAAACSISAVGTWRNTNVRAAIQRSWGASHGCTGSGIGGLALLLVLHCSGVLNGLYAGVLSKMLAADCFGADVTNVLAMAGVLDVLLIGAGVRNCSGCLYWSEGADLQGVVMAISEDVGVNDSSELTLDADADGWFGAAGVYLLFAAGDIISLSTSDRGGVGGLVSLTLPSSSCATITLMVSPRCIDETDCTNAWFSA